MMNKKGISIFKTILFIILSVLFCVLVVYVINYINTKNKKENYTKYQLQLNDSLEYNPLDDIYSYYIYSYANSNFANTNSYNNNFFNYESNSNVFYYGKYVSSDNTQTIYGIWNNTTSPYTYPLAQEVNKSENNLYLAKDLYNAHYIARTRNSWNSVRSWSVGYNCDIDVKDFNFLMHYNFPVDSYTKNIYFYIYTDTGSMRVQFNFNTSTTIYNFSSSLIESTLPSATKVLRFGFAFAQNASSSNAVYYLPQSNGSSGSTNGINYDNNQVYENYFNTLTLQQKNNICYMEFITSEYSSDYLLGYDKGFNDATYDSNQQINSLNTTISNQLETINDLNSSINALQVEVENLQQQVNLQNENFKGLFFTLADVPFKTVANVLGFEVFGVNLFNFFIGLITALGLIWLVKKFV